MKKSLKLTARALVMGTVLAGGVTLVQSFYTEVQASTQKCAKVYFPETWNCMGPASASNCTCGTTGLR